ncbi:hypothetical protein [Pontibacter indicus]|uniref:Uncharacterized protein n=1 Tax=Pontibacter indicus TaxID=1317125 RepID=A0A1R3X6L4_9BACT|nr:hypothetical protein [Pontibacter indicus]SIT85805.1 hypothetical protein SAMN05444128_1603 [Pontibacter indicus]
MELDDLKRTWQESKSQVQSNSSINIEMMEKMKDKYRLKLRKITLSEIVGSVVCLASAMFIAANFDKLDTPLLLGAGVLSILLLLALPLISLFSTRQLSKVGDFEKPYADTLKVFANEKIKFIRLQKINVTLSYLLLIIMIVLVSGLFSDKDIFSNKYYWILSIPLGYIFLLFYSKWVRNYYHKVLQESEELLKELPL